MNLTSQSMQDVIMRNIGDVDVDPHLKKLLEELNSLKEEIYGSSKPKNKTEPVNQAANNNVVIANNRPKKPRKSKGEDAAFRASVAMFGEIRKSGRLSGKTPKYNLIDDIDEIENQKLFSNGQLKFQRKSFEKRTSYRRLNTSSRVILKTEEITDEMLDNICYNVTEKVYDTVNGSSCHQCRQKTRDTKTICRNLDCIGVRGQFCGPCAKNRYGVDVKEALLDPYWSCFVCQDICNCSFCRIRKGKRPTGILTPLAKKEGHESVKEFLDDLKHKLSEEDDYKEYMQDPESVLGFDGHDTVYTPDGKEELFKGSEAETAALSLCGIIDFIENIECFRGFVEDTKSQKKSEKLNRILDSLSKN